MLLDSFANGGRGGASLANNLLVLQSPLCVWEFIHRLVEMLNKTFENVSELDIMINSALVRLETCQCTCSCVCGGRFHVHIPRLPTDACHVGTLGSR